MYIPKVLCVRPSAEAPDEVERDKSHGKEQKTDRVRRTFIN